MMQLLNLDPTQRQTFGQKQFGLDAECGCAILPDIQKIAFLTFSVCCYVYKILYTPHGEKAIFHSSMQCITLVWLSVER